MNALELVTTEEILAELANRFDVLILQGIRYTSDDRSRYNTFMRVKGNAVLALGLCEMLKDYAKGQIGFEPRDAGDVL